MKVLFIAGFGPIAADVAESRRLYESALGIAFKVEEGEYLHTEQVDGARAFAVWPLSQAAESCFGTTEWPADIARPTSPGRRRGSSSTSTMWRRPRASSRRRATSSSSATAPSPGARP